MDRETSTNSIFVFIFGFIFGVLVSSFVFISPLLCILVIFVGLAVLFAEKIWNKEINNEVLILTLLLLSFGLGCLRYSIKDFHTSLIPDSRGTVSSEPEQKENTTSFILRADNGEKVLVSTDLYSSVHYGDRVEVRGTLDMPGIIDDENGGRPFDYGKYLAKDDVYYTLGFAEVKILSSGNGSLLKRTLFKMKINFVSHVKEILAEPYASLLSGLIVAGRDALPKDILEEFRRAGVVHIVVLSGFNITLIAELLRRIFQSLFILTRTSRFPQAPALASIAGVLLFVVMTGGEATVVRAALMSLTVIVAGLFGRNYSAPRALLAAGFLMLIENPKILVFDPSFQLSFLATLGLIYVMPPLEKKLVWVTGKWQVRTTLAQTLATQLTVLPLLIYMMGDVSLVSLPANMLILLIVPYTMLFGFLATLGSYVSALLVLPLTYTAHLLLSWILFVAHTLGNLTFATIKIPPLSIWIVILAYITLMWYILRQEKGGFTLGRDKNS